MNLNSLILEGVVIGEPHLVETKEFYSDVLNFTVETTRYYRNRAGEDVEEKSLFKVVAFGGMSKFPLKEGSGVRVVGRLKEINWTDGDGVTHSEVQVVAEQIEMRAKK